MKRALILANAASMIHLFNRVNIKLLQDNGCEVHIACNFLKGNNFSLEKVAQCKKEWENSGIVCHQIDFERTPFTFKNISVYKQTKKLIESLHFDIIHCHTPIVSVFTRFAARRLKQNSTKVIYTAHGFHFFKGGGILSWILYYPLEKLMAKHTDFLITINKEDYDRAKRKFKVKSIINVPGVGIDVDDISVLKPCINIRKNLNIPEAAPILVSVGELRKLKNHKLIIDAMTKIDRDDVHYIIIGIGCEKENLSEIAKACGLKDRVHLLGFCEDVYTILKESDIFVFPSHREGLSVALMEAMACGLPAVVSEIRGNVDLIDGGRGGYLYSPNDAFGFAEGIEKILSDKSLKKEMGDYNQKKVKAYSEQNVSKLLSDIYFEAKGDVTNETEHYSADIQSRKASETMHR